MKKYMTHIIPLLAALLALCGCSALSDEELSPADISLAELETRMAKATDPHGRFAAATTFVMKQEVETKRFMESPLVQMIETRIMRPNFFKLTTYEDNRPMRAIISNGESSWLVDYEAKRVRTLDADKMRRTKVLSDITSPGGKLSGGFKETAIRKCRIGDRVFYKISCRNPGDALLNLYVDAETFQPERITVESGGKVSYDSSLRGYGLYEGIRIPEETLVKSDGVEQVYKVIYCKLNSPIDPSEFRPPVF